MNTKLAKSNRPPTRLLRGVALIALMALAGDAAAANFVVRMQSTSQGFRFVPRDITITVGDSVTWTNLDFTGHDSVSGTNGVSSGFWRTPLFGFGGSANVVFTNFAPRSYGYYCTPHVFVGMVGSVTVLPPNTPPTVTICEPTNGAVIEAGVPLTIIADPQDADGRIVRVDFFVDGAPLASVNTPPYEATYANPTPGNHSIRVVAVDNGGATSAPATITVRVPGLITLAQPADGTVFTQLNAITLVATIVPDAPVTNVEFFGNGIRLGLVTPPPPGTSAQLSWLPASYGNYELRAVATDSLAQRGTSAPVTVLVYDPADTVAPTLALTDSPPNFARLRDTNIVRIAGRAADNLGLAGVELLLTNQFSGGTNVLTGTTTWLVLEEFGPGVQTTDWNAILPLRPGQNTLLARSVDLATNYSMTVTRYLSFVTNRTVTVQMNGEGSATPNLDGRMLEVGKTYRMMAKPARGWIFDSWTVNQAMEIYSQGPELQFAMQPDFRLLTAHFIPSPFANVSGPYSGLIQDTNASAGNGLVTLQLSESGSFSGHLRVTGQNYSFRGALDSSRVGNAVVLRPALTPIVLWLTNVSDTLTGSATDGSWNADLLCYRNPFVTGSSDPPRVGSPILFVRAPTNAPAGQIKVSGSGKVSMSVFFTDRRRASAASSISADGYIPMAFSSSHSDSLVGWVNVGHADDPMPAILGEVY